MMNSKLMSWVTAAVCATALTGLARADDIEAVTKVVQRMLPGMPPDHVIESPVFGLYEVGFGPEILYVTKDGRFAVLGVLFFFVFLVFFFVGCCVLGCLFFFLG